MTTYTYESEKQVLKLYIRLLLYVNDKYSENESSKIDPNSLLGYLHSLKEETLLQQVLKNKLRNNEMYNDGQALDVSFYDLYNENIDSAEPLAPVEVPTETLDTDPYSEQYRPPFPNSAAMKGKEPILSLEQRKMVNTIKTNPTLVGVYDLLFVNAKDIQLKFIEAALPMFIANKWDEKTPFDKSAQETLIKLIAKLVDDEEERKRILAETPLIAQTRYEDEDEEELAQLAPVIAPEQLAPQQLTPVIAPEQVAPEQLAPQQLAPEQLAPQQLAPVIAPEQVAPVIAPEQVAPAQQKRKVTFATPEQTQAQAQAQAPLVEEQRQTNRNTLMTNKNPMQKFKILLGPNVITKLRLKTDKDFEKWYKTPSTKSNLILSLDALIQSLNTNMKTGKSATEIFDKSKAEMPNYIKSYLSRGVIKILLATPPVQDILLNVKTNILEIYDYSNGINDFIQDLTEVVNDLKRIANKV